MGQPLLRHIRQHWQRFQPVAGAPLLLIGTLWCCHLLIYHLLARPTPLHRADRLLVQRQYYTAMQHYTALATAEQPPAALLLRLGMLHSIRGEYGSSSNLLWQAISRGLPPHEYELALLYLGRNSANSTNLSLAQTIWQDYSRCQPVRPTCPYVGVRHVLMGDALLQHGDYAAAHAAYTRALELPLDAAWRRLATTRTALLLAREDREAARDLLATAHLPTPADRVEPFTAPLLPPRYPQEQQLLADVLAANPADQLQLLGQLYLLRGDDALALHTFQQIPASNPHYGAAQAYIAYLQWRTSPDLNYTDGLTALATSNPAEPPAATLLLLSQMIAAALDQTSVPTSTLQRVPSGSAEHALVQATWHLFERDYAAARPYLRQVLARSSGTQRGHYALRIARFHHDTTYEQCSDGLDAAMIAVRELPASVQAWTLLAGIQFQCGDFAVAQRAAHQAIALDDATPGLQPPAEAWLYLGAAQLWQGDTHAARTALITAADLAPASTWRERAEPLLHRIP